MTPNSTYVLNGVTIKEKIVPDGAKWTIAKNAKEAGFSVGSAFKQSRKLSGDTGKVKKITIHNTEDLSRIENDAERYTLATYNEAMGGTQTHFYVDETSVWQLLKAGTGLCDNDPEGSAEVNWTCGDNTDENGGNKTSIAIELIMNENAASDAKAKDNAARIAAWLLWKHGLTMDDLVTHTYWVNKKAGKTFADVDKQCTNPIYGKRWCPCYIFASNNADVAYKNWKAFKEIVKSYYDKLMSDSKPDSDKTDTNTLYRVQIGAFRDCKNAENYLETAKSKGFEGFVVRGDDNLLRVQIGAFVNKQNAENYLAQAKAEGFDGFVVSSAVTAVSSVKPQKKSVEEIASEVIRGDWGNGQERFDKLLAAGYDYNAVQDEVERRQKAEKSPSAAAPTIKVGSTVTLRKGATDYNGGKLAAFVYDRPHIVSEIKGDRAVITFGGNVVAAVNIKDLTLE